MRQASLLLASVCSALLSIASAEAQTVGVSAAVNQNARGIRPGAGIRTIVLGDNVVYNERIETDTVGLLQILLADGTAFTVGPNSAISIDRFVYDPAAGTAEVTASLTKGVFRFIGGKTSKTPGGVTLNTPVGTIGIRGAMVTMNFGGGGGQGSGPVTSHIDLGFGEGVTLDSPGGEALRIFKPGYSIVISRNADGSEKREVRRTPPGLANEIQTQLSGAPGTSGGASEQPTDPAVVVSGISTENSDRPPFENTPVPTARPTDETMAAPEERIVQESSTDLARNEVQEEIAEAAVAPTPGPTVIPPAARTIPFSVLTAGATYETTNGDVIINPGLYGLLGGSTENDVTANLQQADGSSSASGLIPQGTLILPLFTDSSFTVRNISFTDGASLGGVPLYGTVYSGPDDFAAYTLAINGDRTNAVYALTGTPTDDLSKFLNGDVRTYAFSEDFLQDIPVPFMQADAVDADYSLAAITPFYVAEEPGASSDSSSRLFQSWLVIGGQGAAQKSAIGVNVGEFFEDDDGSYSTVYARRGSYRADSSSIAFAFTGGVASAGVDDATTDLFGSNAQTMVLGYDVAINDDFGDAPADRSGGTNFGTFHVLSLTDEKPIADFTTSTGATRDLGAVPNTVISGFSAGIDEGIRADDSTFFFPLTSGSDTANTILTFNGANNSFGAEFEVGTDLGSSSFSLQVAFGDDIGGNGANDGRSVYINDDVFAATQSRNQSRTVYRNFNGSGNVTSTGATVPGDSPKTYLVSGDAVPQPSLLPQGQMCACKFLEWGWWGTQVRSEEVPGDGTEGFREGIHLGTWVAGDVTNASQLSTLAGTTATYEGHALANVLTDDGSSFGNYVAFGSMSMDWDFSMAGGSMEIRNLDGRNFDGNLAQTGSGGAAGFSGSLTQINTSTNAAVGPVNGAFVNDGATIAEGVIGNLNLSSGSGDWSAVGIIAGARQ